MGGKRVKRRNTDKMSNWTRIRRESCWCISSLLYYSI